MIDGLLPVLAGALRSWVCRPWPASQRPREHQGELYVLMPVMSKRSLPVRAGWLLAAVLQLTLPAAAAWADARLDAAESHAVAHIESHTTTTCARIHPPDCALCHFLSAPGVASRASAPPIPAANERRAGQANPAALSHRLARPHPQPRAPPALS